MKRPITSHGKFGTSLTREFLKNCVLSLPLAMTTPSAAAEKIPDSVSLQLGARTFEQAGHMAFCKTHADECNVRSDDTTPLRLTRKIWNNIVAVNVFVNKSIKGASDTKLYGVEEKWAYPVKAGDCEDFALQKRKLLLKQGIAASSLILTVVEKKDKKGHAVLTVRTDHGDYFLDNLVLRPYPVNKYKYNILKAQNPAHSGEWVFVSKDFMPAPSTVPKAMSTGASAPGPR
ncbi:MAG TPA: transglutaminase-like cysteine peptidase [Micavibrio sp.]|nr:transglutaminase-like cysteine peptidase [Micavibrio sp.]